MKTILIQVTVLAVLLLVAEWGVRIFTDINTYGASSNLYEFGVYGEGGTQPTANHPAHVIAASFGANIYTDDKGFRIPSPAYRYPASDKAILFLGDSVTFGVGVEETKTFVGRLRTKHQDIALYNAAVSGHNTQSYLGVIAKRIPQLPNVKHVYMVFAFNDLQHLLAEKQEKSATEAVTKQNGVRVDRQEESTWRRITLAIKEEMPAVRKAYEWLLGHSELFVGLRYIGRDNSKLWFNDDLRLFQNKVLFNMAMKDVLTAKHHLQQRNITYMVVIPPYELQVREPEKTEYMYPQQQLHTFFKQHNIEYIDAYEAFTNMKIASQELYLYKDHMHLSAKGHEAVFNAVKADAERKLSLSR